MGRKERLTEFNRENILAAAKVLFQTKGLIETTMDDIAKEAEYSKSTVYVYFKSKDEIYNHIILEHFTILKDCVSETLTSAQGFPEGYFAVCKALAEYSVKYPLFFESILGEVKMPDGEPEDVLSQIYEVGEEVNEIFGAYLNKCINAKQIKLDVPIPRATFILWAGITGIISMAQHKELYINKAMGISKDEFMNDGFRLLLKSLEGKGK